MSRSELESRAPHDCGLIWRGPLATPEDVAAAVERARAAQPAWEDLGPEGRDAVARAFARAVLDKAEPLARTIALETGKPLWEARTEVASVAAKVDLSIAAREARAGRSSRAIDAAGSARQTLEHRPHGVLGVLGPFNFPAHLPNGHIVPALLAGNVVVFKPSEEAPAVADAMAALWAEAGLPQGVLEIVHGRGNAGRALAAAAIDGLMFTGSSRTGAALARQFAETPWRILALEMGGNAPFVAWDVADAEVEAVAALIAQSAYLTAGQRCTAARRLIVEQGPRGERLVDALVAHIDRLRLGGPFDEPQPFLGPVISNDAADRLAAQAQALGGRALRALRRPVADRPFLAPALLDMEGQPAPDEERFGPLLLLWREPDVDAAFARAADSRYGLAAALAGGDEALFRRFRRVLRAGVVNWNRPTNGASSAAPFGGVGLSGNHRPSAYYAADSMAWPMAGIVAPRAEAPDTPGVAPPAAAGMPSPSGTPAPSGMTHA